MKKDVNAYSIEDGSYQTCSVVLPSACPICGVSLHPEVMYSAVFYSKNTDELEKLYLLNLCSSCTECFISEHNYDEENDIFNYVSSAPNKSIPLTFSAAIQNLSPDFVSIYKDSLHAESLGLTSICGMGYRKALEYLVKDYCISKNPDSEEKISKLPLAKCIEQYIDNQKLKTLAKASAWLGNDETHYVKKHPEYGLSKLKSFVMAFVTFADYELSYEEAAALISSD